MALLSKRSWEYTDLDEFVSSMITNERVMEIFTRTNNYSFTMIPSIGLDNNGIVYYLEVRIYDSNKNQRTTRNI